LRGTSRRDLRILALVVLVLAGSVSLVVAAYAAAPAFRHPIPVRSLVGSGNSVPDGLAEAGPPAADEAGSQVATTDIPLVAAPQPPAAPAQPPTTPAAPVPASGAGQLDLINAERGVLGLAPLVWSECLAGVATGEAVRMARDGAISHGSGVQHDLACGIGSSAAENVGVWSAGVNDTQLHAMFLDSPGHRANILGSYRYVGSAWAVTADGKAYIAVEFA
jgi:uncharacterized protein YkwD